MRYEYKPIFSPFYAQYPSKLSPKVRNNNNLFLNIIIWKRTQSENNIKSSLFYALTQGYKIDSWQFLICALTELLNKKEQVKNNFKISLVDIFGISDEGIACMSYFIF